METDPEQFHIQTTVKEALFRVLIINAETVITGLFNFTKAVEGKNAEYLLIINSKEMANIYLNNWTKHKEHPGSGDNACEEHCFHFL